MTIIFQGQQVELVQDLGSTLIINDGLRNLEIERASVEIF